MVPVKGIAWIGALAALSAAAQGVWGQPIISRVKDIATLDGIQDNIIFGYGIVGGLEGTGDGRQGFTRQSLANVLNVMGVKVRANEVIPDNAAAVWVEAVIPPYARPGTRIDARVTSIGQAESLQGGFLLATPLKGYDGRVHGIAQGPLSIGGFRVGAAGGGGGAVVQQNHTLVGLIPNGVILEGEMIDHEVVQEGNSLRWLLNDRDFKTASNLQRKINAVCGRKIAVAEDAGSVRVFIGMNQAGQIVVGQNAFDSMVDAIAFVDDLEIETDEPAKIVINERTGTVVAGRDIRVRNVVVAHGPLRITIQSSPEVTPGGFGAQPVVTQQVQADVEEGDKVALVEGTTVGEVVENLNDLGYTPRDLIAIFQMMAAAGAIKAEVVIQ